MVDVRECGEADVELLEQRMPTGGHRAHAHHFAGQQAGSCTYLVAWAGPAPVGCCLVGWAGSFDAAVREALPDAVELSNIGVHADARGRGVGTTLIRSAEELVVARGRGLVTVGVGDDNPRAAALYARLGYHDTGLRFTARYRYVDGDGIERDMVEHIRTLAKRL